MVAPYQKRTEGKLPDRPDVDPTKRVQISRPYFGLAAMQVCTVADATDDEILEVCNRENPSGTSGGWSAVIRNPKEHKMPAKCKPVNCETHKERIHFIVIC